MLLPFVAVHQRLGSEYAWTNCSKCLATAPRQSRAGMRCGYIDKEKWTPRARCWVPGTKILEPLVCPGYSTGLPRTKAVAEAWGWWEKGQMQLVHPDPPEVLTDLVGLFNMSVQSSRDYYLETKKNG